jgi:DNA repair protein RadA/Sms
MKAPKSVFVCGACGAQFPKWLGKCNDCGEWNTLSEETVSSSPTRGAASPSGKTSTIVPLTQVAQRKEKRVNTGIGELDRVLGGGMVPGSLTLLSGDPGIGKSTLLLQALHALAKNGHKVLYASGEESSQQIRLRADRLSTVHPNIFLTNENDMDAILAGTRTTQPDVLVVDSIQTVFSARFPSSPGSVTQIRECTNMLLEPSKGQGISTWVVGHVTKEGAIAGPKLLEHLVDTVMHLEGDAASGYRILRSVKNRFGSTGEIGVFTMHGDGLAEVVNPSALFLEGHRRGVAGSAVAICMEGSRPLLVEVQSLVGRSNLAVPRRIATGLESSRVSILVAVLEKHGGLNLSSNDLYASVAGGLKLTEPAIDLAVAVAIASSLRNRPLPGHFAYVGEVGLSGEIRACPHIVQRVAEARKMGFERVYIPSRNYKNEKQRLQEAAQNEIQLYPVENLGEAISLE